MKDCLSHVFHDPTAVARTELDVRGHDIRAMLHRWVVHFLEHRIQRQVLKQRESQ